jgi:hypothetical protein
MTPLISKVQYKNFELGEFVDVRPRTCEETIELIERFPWNEQRENIIIDLTNPSVTIEGKNNDFLKFALYYNQKFVLHYFDKSEVLYSKSFLTVTDAYDYIKNYFEQPVFDTTGFRKENTWMQHNAQHFVTQDFRYVVTPQSVKHYLWSTSGINFILSVIMLGYLGYKGFHPVNPMGLIILLLIVFFWGGGLNLILFSSYYGYVKDMLLIMSKCNDIFYFGYIGSPAKFNKKDILQYTVIKARSSKNPVGGFAIVEIEFKDGTLLTIPNLLIDHLALKKKLFEYPRIDKNKFPSLRL